MLPQGNERLQIVGIDGSDGSQRALQWATEHVDTLGPIQPVMTWRHPWWALLPTDLGRAGPLFETDVADAAKQEARRQVDRLDAAVCRPPLIIHGAAGPALVAVAQRGSVLVVGSSGRGGVAAQLLGSTSRHCVQHSARPVIVVPGEDPADVDPSETADRVVVGVDGSEASQQALDWVIGSTPTHWSVEAIHVWSAGGVSAEVPGLAGDHVAAMSENLVADVIGSVQARVADTGRAVNGRSRQGDPRAVLRQEAATAALLVVGGRRHEGPAHLLLGSTATALIEHPLVPTAVVPSVAAVGT